MFYSKKVTDMLTGYVMSTEKNKMQRDLQGIFGNDYYGTATISDESIEYMTQIFDLTDSMVKTLKEANAILNASNFYVSSHERNGLTELLKIRNDVTAVKIDSDFKEMREHMAHIMKKKPLLKHMKAFLGNTESLEELKKYSYACDVLYL